MQEKNVSFNNFEQCIKCTICTAYCPVVAVNPSYPGPKQAGPDGERLRLKDKYFFDENLKYCMNCKRCEVACPSGAKIADLIHSARRRYSRDQHGPYGQGSQAVCTYREFHHFHQTSQECHGSDAGY